MPAAKLKSARAKKGAARKRGKPDASLNKALANASWAAADAALADALACMDELAAAPDAASRKAALTLLQQALARAARKRGLTRLGDIGVREPYDRARHELSAAATRTPKQVQVIARGVARGGEVLVKPRVAPAPRAKRR